MKQILKLLLVLLFCSVASSTRGQGQVHWSVLLERPDLPAVEISSFDGLPEKKLHFQKTIDGIKADVRIKPENNFVEFEATASSAAVQSCFISLKADFSDGTPYSYLGEVQGRQIFRQSPHDPGNYELRGMTKQAVPMLAVKTDSGFIVALSDTPAVYDNYTTQTIDSKNHTAMLSSGDGGEVTGDLPQGVKIEKYYHRIDQGYPHDFSGILFKSSGQNLNDLRKNVLFAVAGRWGEKTAGRLEATAFGGNYMLVRSNETQRTHFWVVPGMEYCNKEYTRDAFWQSMVLPPKYSQECYQNEALAQTRGAERPLFCMVWAYRTKLEGGTPDMAAARETLQYIEQHTKDGYYYSSDIKGKKDFQSWYDTAAFNEDDVITYNQGLLAVALLSAEALNLKPAVSSAEAIQKYQGMFNEQAGYFPLSRQKNLLAMDPLVGDLLAQIYFKKALLSDQSVRSHFKQIVAHAKTPYGFKVTCLPDGSYAPKTAYDAGDFSVHWEHPGTYQWGGSPGNYQWGGSWYLYDMTCLIDCYLHGAPGALDEITWRGALDFKLGGTYFEFINTVTGKPEKPNQGWNAAVYAIWNKLMKQGSADHSLLEAIDKS